MWTVGRLVGAYLAIVWGTANAATLRDIGILFDGSQDPPGDQVRVELSFLPGETELNLEVRALVVSGRRDENVARIPSPVKEYQDAEGNFLARQKVERGAAKSPFITTLVTVPYRALGLKLDGDETLYLIGYEVTAYREVGGKRVIDFVAPSELTEVQLREGERKATKRTAGSAPLEIEYALSPGRVLDYKTDTLAAGVKRFVVEGKLAFAEESLTPENLGVKVTQSTELVSRPVAKFGMGAPVKDVAVSIPNHYKRESLPDGQTRAASSKNVVDENNPWRYVYYATNRKVVKNSKKADRYGDVDGSLEYGKALIHIPIRFHKRGTLEVVNWWNYSGKDKKAFYVEELITPKTAKEMYGEMSKDDILLFIHGFNNTFSEALLVAAQISYDIQFPGKTMAFAWPSQGSETKYGTDETRALESVDNLSVVLRDLGNEVRTAEANGRKKKIHIIAHSLGNRLTLLTMAELFLKDREAKEMRLRSDAYQPAIDKLFTNIVFAAPDLITSQFDALVPFGIEASKSTTFYYSKYDLPLGASEINSGRDRAGNFPSFSTGMDTICADQVNSRLVGVGHSYVRSADEVLDDLGLLFNHGFSPKDRQPPLGPKETLRDYPGRDHYYFLLKGK